MSELRLDTILRLVHYQRQTAAIDCGSVGALSDEAVARLIVAQAALPPGTALTPAQAEDLVG
ncbi:hypothetical protein F1D05_10145 [Kribbella qitaiheensis]|uniref:Uncharacterized protein n=1 Tax=Kribbella qitaiheensis TaxID=1544730 RepID=A0A7G6WW25_9ACTN|nr:hypothetical protein [Kribbella qitaiheensis]QNE18190.1 hypothetical protein F1D05_10145 [Kribbella qitaiheensis]